MPIQDDIARTALIEELNIHKTEFSAIRAEIQHWIDGQKQYLNLNLLSIAAGLGFAPLISEQEAYIVLLLFPIVFHVLMWEMITSRNFFDRLVNYLAETLIPRVNTILDKLGSDREGTIALGWELQVKTIRYSTVEKTLSFFSPSLHLVPMLAVGALLISYASLTASKNYTPTSGEIALVFLHLLLLIFAVLRVVISSRELAQKAHQWHALKESLSMVQSKSIRTRKTK